MMGLQMERVEVGIEVEVEIEMEVGVEVGGTEKSHTWSSVKQWSRRHYV